MDQPGRKGSARKLTIVIGACISKEAKRLPQALEQEKASKQPGNQANQGQQGVSDVKVGKAALPSGRRGQSQSMGRAMRGVPCNGGKGQAEEPSRMLCLG